MNKDRDLDLNIKGRISNLIEEEANAHYDTLSQRSDHQGINLSELELWGVISSSP